MTREEEIIEAGIEYTMQNSPCCIGGDNFYEQAKEFNRNKSFEAGVKWSDEHPKSPWISVKDSLPCDHDDFKYFDTTVRVIVIDVAGNIFFSHMVKDKNTGKWNWEDGAGITDWTPIPKLVN